MITLLSTVFGFLGSLLPEGIKIFKDKQDKKHELEMTRLEMEREAKGFGYKMQEMDLNNLATLNTGIREVFKSGNTFTDILNNTVRPVLTYGLFLDYVVMKIMVIVIAIDSSAAYDILYNILWTDEDRAIFGAIIGYYFGNRTLTKGKV